MWLFQFRSGDSYYRCVLSEADHPGEDQTVRARVGREAGLCGVPTIREALGPTLARLTRVPSRWVSTCSARSASRSARSLLSFCWVKNSAHSAAASSHPVIQNHSGFRETIVFTGRLHLAGKRASLPRRFSVGYCFVKIFLPSHIDLSESK